MILIISVWYSYTLNYYFTLCLLVGGESSLLEGGGGMFDIKGDIKETT
jgi:hypothetical protein